MKITAKEKNDIFVELDLKFGKTHDITSEAASVL